MPDSKVGIVKSVILNFWELGGGRALPDYNTAVVTTYCEQLKPRPGPANVRIAGEFQSLGCLGMQDIKCDGKTIGFSIRISEF